MPASADAYRIQSQLTKGCHEQAASRALRAVRGELSSAAPLAPSGEDQALIDDVPFAADEDMKDLGATTFLVSIRDSDLKGRAADDLSALAEIHGSPDN